MSETLLRYDVESRRGVEFATAENHTGHCITSGKAKSCQADLFAKCKDPINTCLYFDIYRKE